MAEPRKYGSDYMNELLDRIGATAHRTAPTEPIGPTFHILFTTILDRLDALEQRIDNLQTQVNYPDGDPSYL